MHAPSFIRLFWRLLNDRRVWFLPKLVLIIGLIYVIVPVDAVCDVLLPFGYIDDLLVLLIAAKVFIRLCPQNVVREHVQLIDQGG